jgi:hypothetical protein
MLERLRRDETAAKFVTIFFVYLGVALSILGFCVLLSIAVLIGNRIIGV